MLVRIVASTTGFILLVVAILCGWGYVRLERAALLKDLEVARNDLAAEREMSRRAAEAATRMEAVNAEQRRKIEGYARRLDALSAKKENRAVLDMRVPDDLVDGLCVAPSGAGRGDGSGVASGGDGGSGHDEAGDGAEPSDTLSHP